MLHKAAQVVVADRDGVMPDTAAELRRLPGIGGYTSAAIASIAHGEPVAVVDGNVERVLCRLAGWDAIGGATLRSRIEEMAGRLLDAGRPGDFNQALIELGATVCVPRNPQCLLCPLSPNCKTQGEHKTLPRARTVTREIAHALCLRAAPGESGDDQPDHEVLLEQRSASATIMPGLWELPAMRKDSKPAEDVRMTVRHAIMQVNYSVRIHDVTEEEVPAQTVAGGERRWVLLRDARAMALTGLARKVLQRARFLPRRVPDTEIPEAGVLAAP
jgi:A/G-specific adenine glycosylase